MVDARAPRWLSWLEKRMGWIAIPQIAILLVTLQALGFLMVASNPAWLLQLTLDPMAVMAGEPWRLVTFLSLPLTRSPFWLIFVLWFLYFVTNTLEKEWGSFRATLYVLVSVLVTIAYSFAADHPVFDVSHFQSSLFLAAAALYPEFEVSLFMVIPVKMKWLAVLAVVFLAVEAYGASWGERGLMVATFSNYLLFFGPIHWDQAKRWFRRRKHSGKFGQR
ncbi:MAG: rhomboid family intramembrane serine protease [Bdellovibrionales bacterium]|nr:rhomboid family intramembrane serine protease [Bdellovibrionales bacterium]